MSFKQNLPAFAIVGAAALVVGLIVATRPPDEDLLRRAAAEHVKTIDKARDFKVVGETVDVALADGGVLHLSFVKRDGDWRFDRDLGQDFARKMQEPASGTEILERLGRRISQRFNAKVDVPSGLRYAYRVGRDPRGVVGEVVVSFDYPKAEGKQMAGRYVETFLWKAGAWENQGGGQLFDSAAPR